MAWNSRRWCILYGCEDRVVVTGAGAEPDDGRLTLRTEGAPTLRITTGAEGLMLGAADDDETVSLLRSGAGTIVGNAGRSATGSLVGVGLGEPAPAAWLIVRLAQPAIVVANALAVIRIFIPEPEARR